MQKLLLFLCMSLLFVGCEVTNENEPDNNPSWAVRTYSIKSNQWTHVGQVNAPGSYYMCEFNENALTPFVCNSGIVVGYIYTKVSSTSVAQNPLPYIIYDMTDDAQQSWSIKYSFDYMPGSIAFYCHYNDFITEYTPGDCEFRVTMIW
ncbi:MAG: hypothetical protein Q4F97_05045 [Bacteroidales bacterium]|nr:hypothetical protein [Bacteroidales bacterium]